MGETAHHKRVVVVGAGFGGLNAAKRLSGHGFDILLVDRNNYHLFIPLLYQVATGNLGEEEIAGPLRQIFRAHPDVRFLRANVQQVDLKQRQIVTDAGSIDYDYLVLAPGSVTNYFGNSAIQQQAYDVKALDDAAALRSHILDMFERATHAADPEQQQALMTFLIVGGGPTGVEYAGALAELVRHTLRRDYAHLPMQQAKIYLVEGQPYLLAPFPDRLRQYAQRRLERLGVEVRLNMLVSTVEGEHVQLKDGTLIRAATLVWAAGVQAPPLIAALDGPKARGGRVNVAPDLSLPAHPEVFVVGDMAYREQDGQPIPQLAQPAIQGGRYVAEVIVKQRERGEHVPPFRYRNLGTMAVIGRFAAIADLPVLSLQLTGIVAWAIWLVVHLYQLVGFRNRVVAMLDWGYDYLRSDPPVRLITGGTSEQTLAILQKE
ncbi:MAG: NAD(P)/FAD-dependent oxidoreductase [Roseiflexaceae bacterium]